MRKPLKISTNEDPHHVETGKSRDRVGEAGGSLRPRALERDLGMVSTQKRPQVGRWERAYKGTTKGSHDIVAKRRGNATNASKVSKMWGIV